MAPLPRSYYSELSSLYANRRDRILEVLKEVGFRFNDPDGAYYIMADITPFSYDDDMKFAEFLVKEIGVAVVPGSSFYHKPEMGRTQVRFCFCKRDETLVAARDRLKRLSAFVK